MTAQETIAATLAGSDVSVVFDAETPWTDLKTKVIHLRPVPEQLDEEAVEDLRGDCDHELGHIVHTDPEAIGGIKRQLVRCLAFSIEDGRVERLIGAEWLGCGENLERSSRRAVLRIGANAEDDEPMFVLLARDPLAPSIVRRWAKRYLKKHIDALTVTERVKAKHAEALECARAMEAWKAHGEESYLTDFGTFSSSREANCPLW